MLNSQWKDPLEATLHQASWVDALLRFFFKLSVPSSVLWQMTHLGIFNDPTPTRSTSPLQHSGTGISKAGTLKQTWPSFRVQKSYIQRCFNFFSWNDDLLLMDQVILLTCWYMVNIPWIAVFEQFLCTGFCRGCCPSTVSLNHRFWVKRMNLNFKLWARGKYIYIAKLKSILLLDRFGCHDIQCLKWQSLQLVLPSNLVSWTADFQLQIPSKLCPNRWCHFSHLSAIDPWLYKEIPFAAQKTLRQTVKPMDSGLQGYVDKKEIVRWITTYHNLLYKLSEVILKENENCFWSCRNPWHRRVSPIIDTFILEIFWLAIVQHHEVDVTVAKKLCTSHDHLTNRATSTLKPWHHRLIRSLTGISACLQIGRLKCIDVVSHQKRSISSESKICLNT